MKIVSKLLLISTILISTLTIYSFALNDSELDLYINDSLIITDHAILMVEGNIMIPMVSVFETLGAQVYFHEKSNTISSYYLNNFTKVKLNYDEYYVNGLLHSFSHKPLLINDIYYVPLDYFLSSIDLTLEKSDKDSVYLTTNNSRQYTNFNNNFFHKIIVEEDGIRYSTPQNWEKISTNKLGYFTTLGTVFLEYSFRTLNDNIDVEYIINTHKDNLLLEFEDKVTFKKTKKVTYNYHTSNVLYITNNVNEIVLNQIVHFIEDEDKIYKFIFTYPEGLIEEYLFIDFDKIINSFSIDNKSLDMSKEHYIEYNSSMKLGLHLNNDVYSNMIVQNYLPLKGYFNSDLEIDSLTVTVTKNNKEVQFFIPVIQNSFSQKIYTPFGLGKHDIKIEITKKEEKIVFTNTNAKQPHSDFTDYDSKLEDNTLLRFSVININKDNIRYKIPTKYVQSGEHSIRVMSDSKTYKYQTDYLKVKVLYKHIVDDIEHIKYNETNFSAFDVYEQRIGTKKEIALYLTALLRAQNLPARVIRGNNDSSAHIWTEVFYNGEWILLDPVGTQVPNVIGGDIETIDVIPTFDASKSIYKRYFPEQRVLGY